jgi:hypothetical protein
VNTYTGKMDCKATVEERKQIIKHLNKRAQDNFKEKNLLMDINAEIEAKLDAKEKLLKDVGKKGRDDFKEELIQMVKKMKVSDKVISNLQKENDSLKKKVEKVVINTLQVKIEDLQKQNDEKRTLIQSLSIAESAMKREIKCLVMKNVILKDLMKFRNC